MTKKIMIFADGTGNAFTQQESNVWRIYQALEPCDAEQISYYIAGVGTSAFRPFAILDAITGIGVPANVRKLWRFLSWNYAPGADIYMFGFSRGSFTIRTLIAMIDSQGLGPTATGAAPTTHGDMVRYSMSAWREYRRHTAPWYKTLPTIWVTRAIRDALLYARDTAGALFGLKSWSQVVALRDKAISGEEALSSNTQATPGIKIKYVGLFDTVEAYGVPIEELRRAIDWSIWPISFRNRKISEHVENVRHALSIDDERTTFHPLRFDVEKTGNRIKEVWFAGVHSDVGGGYPDGALANVPLVWIAKAAVDFGMRLKSHALQEFEQAASPLAPYHDSRSGAAVLYRYEPRRIEADENGEPPVIHISVVEKMVFGSENYAPVSLPGTCKVLAPDGTTHAIGKVSGRDTTAVHNRSMIAKRAIATNAVRTSAAVSALEKLHKPDAAYADRTLNTVWWRRVAYFMLLFMVGVVALLPLMIDTLSDKVIAFSGDGGSTLDSTLNAIFAPLGGALQSILPSYARPYIAAVVAHPFVSSAIIAIALLMWWWGCNLRDTILDYARLAWNTELRKPVNDTRWHPWLRVAALARQSKPAHVHQVMTHYVVPIFATVILLSGLALLAGRILFDARAGAGGICVGAKTTPAPVGETAVTLAPDFSTATFCRATGFSVEANHKYRIRIEIREPWLDRTIMTGVHGFKADALHTLFFFLKRDLAADWFQPMARIGARGAADFALAPLDGAVADAMARKRIAESTAPAACNRDPNSRDAFGAPVRYEESCLYNNKAFQDAHPGYAPTNSRYEMLADGALVAAQDIWRTQNLPRVLVADFVPTSAGEIFLYVNDAVNFFQTPWWSYDLYYHNNSGTAQVTLQRLPLPGARQANEPAN